MAGAVGTLALDGGDARMATASGFDRKGSNAGLGTLESTSSEVRNLHNSEVTFEEYLHYAKISRTDARLEPQERSMNLLKDMRIGRKKQDATVVATSTSDPSSVEEKKINVAVDGTTHPPEYMSVTDGEWIQASRAARTATWGSVFYLITTDILGPFSTPWAFAQMGYGPAVVLYTIFGIFAGYGGYLLWKMFLGLDSDKWPLKTYGDIAFRIYGTLARHFVNITQSIQLLFNVGIIIILNGQSLAQVSQDGACYIILCFVWAIAGALIGQIRTLRNLGWLANAAIWMNLFVIFMTMGIVANSPPYYKGALASNTGPTVVDNGPVITTAGPQEGVDFNGQVVGLMQAVYSYGGAMLFVEFMSEMKRPWDFWKGMLTAQLFIYVSYMLFGLFAYSYQGQYAINPAYQGISTYTWQTAANAIELVTSLIAALLYGNIGIKVIYSNVLMDFFHFPPLTKKSGKYLWCAVVPIYWGVAFILASAIPQVNNLSGLIAAACILQFSYTFPPWLVLGYRIKKDAMLPGDGYNPVNGVTTRGDGGFKRLTRGYMKHWAFNSFNLIYCLGCAATAILGIYSAALGIKAGYASKKGSTFSCKSPVG